jgi:hypothetical protein
MAGLALLCACSTSTPAAPSSSTPQVAAAKPAAAPAPAAATQTAQASGPKVECRRVKVLGSIKYKDECQTKSDSAAATKSGEESRKAAARAIQGASGLGN